ncbi:MAG: sulfatase-like hydrolase/transferase [Verrucomicrobiales bacterium]|nr:sulfatase-like hydrolase/transferase [Verrucomicrobiales bacterium]
MARCIPVFLLLFLVSGSTLFSADEKPNIIFILLDDLGKEWVSCYGADEIETPVFDRLAAEGIRFENFYSMPQCTPTRVAFLTGQYPFRNGWVNHWDVPRWGGGCHFDSSKNPSIARVMQSAGYKTAVAGKWQINDFRVEPEVMVKHGFDDYCMWTGYEAGNPPSGNRYWDPYIHTRAGSRTYEGEFGEDIFADFLIDFMKQNRDEPMFVYYPMCLPHTPFVTTPLEPEAEGKIGMHKAMVRYADHVVGKLVKAIEELEIDDHTILIVTTDNGTSGSISGTMADRLVRGGKTKTTENGINGPFIVYGPGLVPKGKVNHTLCDVTDLLPTFASLGGAKLPEEPVFDGLSFADVILGKSEAGPREWSMAMGGQNSAALTNEGVENMWYFRDRVIRGDRYKLWVSPAREPVKLIDLSKDLFEENNLIGNTGLQSVVEALFAPVADQLTKDNDPIYLPLAPQPWDVKVKAASGEWKSGRPGSEITYTPDSQSAGKAHKGKKKE